MKSSSTKSLLLQMHTEVLLKLIFFLDKSDERGLAVVNSAILFIFENRPQKGFLTNRVTRKFIVNKANNSFLLRESLEKEVTFEFNRETKVFTFSWGLTEG